MLSFFVDEWWRLEKYPQANPKALFGALPCKIAIKSLQESRKSRETVVDRKKAIRLALTFIRLGSATSLFGMKGEFEKVIWKYAVAAAVMCVFVMVAWKCWSVCEGTGRVV